MSQRSVEILIGRLITDEAFRNSFLRDASSAVAAFVESGHEITAVEMGAIAAIAREFWHCAAAEMDPRLQKASLSAFQSYQKQKGEDSCIKETRWFGWIALIAPFHMSEQLLFGIDELARLRRILVPYYAWFQQPDYGTVVLVAVIGSLLFGLTYGILAGGLLKEISLSVWALTALSEIHHILETIAAGRYTPGTVTAIPYVTFGILLMLSIVREHRERVKAAASARRLQQILAALMIILFSAHSFGQHPPLEMSSSFATQGSLTDRM